jgi:integrase/recombinase XerD
MQSVKYLEPLPVALKHWRAWQATTCGPSTINQRHDVLARFVEHVAATHDLDHVDPRHCDAADIAAYLAQEHFGPASRATYFRALRSWFGWLHSSGRIASDPILAIRSPKEPDDDPDPLTDDEADRLLYGYTDQATGHQIPPADGQLLAAIVLGLYAGLRAHEIAGFRGDMIRGPALRITGKGRRTCTLPLSDEIARVAVDMPTTWWFPSPVGRRNFVRPEHVTRMISDRYDLVGIDHGAAHRLRHTYGTRLQESVGDTRIVQELMRHKSIGSTQRYTRVSNDRLRAAIRSLPPLSA